MSPMVEKGMGEERDEMGVSQREHNRSQSRRVSGASAACGHLVETA